MMGMVSREVNTTMILYHGSKSGLDGPIRPVSRTHCDFGPGFYMGTDILQPLRLVCGYESPHLYTLELNTSDLKVARFQTDLDWALYIAYCRGKLDSIESSPLYNGISHIANGADIIVGKIAKDRMFVVLDRFFEGLLTDTALIECLSALNIGDQCVATTPLACSHIQIVDDRLLSAEDRSSYAELSQSNRKLGVSLADRIAREHRRDGRYFDEILMES